MNESQMEELGQIIDRIENLNGSLQLPLPPQMHVDSLKEIVPDLHKQLKAAYFDMGGLDVWS